MPRRSTFRAGLHAVPVAASVPAHQTARLQPVVPGRAGVLGGRIEGGDQLLGGVRHSAPQDRDRADEGGEVRERVAVDDRQVGDLAFLDRAEVVVDAEEAGGQDGRGAQGLRPGRGRRGAGRAGRGGGTGRRGRAAGPCRGRPGRRRPGSGGRCRSPCGEWRVGPRWAACRPTAAPRRRPTGGITTVTLGSSASAGSAPSRGAAVKGVAMRREVHAVRGVDLQHVLVGAARGRDGVPELRPAAWPADGSSGPGRAGRRVRADGCRCVHRAARGRSGRPPP